MDFDIRIDLARIGCVSIEAEPKTIPVVGGIDHSIRPWRLLSSHFDSMLLHLTSLHPDVLSLPTKRPKFE